MKHKFFKSILFALALASPIFVACNDDDDDTNNSKNLSDPRIRNMVINATSKIVVNDVEAIIFNYDSLDKGTNLTSCRPYFYGYISQPTIQYKKNGEWVEFKNGSTLDLSDKVEILCTSQDKSAQKTYTIDLRVHNYDVSAFTWEEYATIGITTRISSQKSFTYNGKNLWFFTDENGVSALLASNDLKNWAKTDLNVSDINWSSSAIWGDSIFVQKKDGSVYTANLGDLTFSAFQTTSDIEKILFAIGDKIWAIGNNEGTRSLLSKNEGDFQIQSTLPADFPTENITTFTSPSGYTSLGYLFATQNGNGTIWSIDSKGNSRVLQKPDGTIPFLKNPNVFQFSEMLGIVGGENEDGTYSSLCFSSKNGGAQWFHDWHKDLNGEAKGLSNSGTFVLSNQGEIIFVSGNTPTKVSNKVWKSVLNKLTADDLNYQN